MKRNMENNEMPLSVVAVYFIIIDKKLIICLTLQCTGVYMIQIIVKINKQTAS